MPFNFHAKPKLAAKSHFISSKKQAGFTLIEIIVGMVTLSIAMGIFFNMIGPAERESADKIHQIKAAELGQAMLDEILGRAFDHHSDHTGSVWRCNEDDQDDCTVEAEFGPEDGGGTVPNVRDDDDEDDRSLFNDVDDYHGYSSLTTATNNALDSGYNDFVINVEVSYQGTLINLSDDSLAKLIVVTITTPLGQDLEFSGFKSNF